jgi:hypothetical protein
VGKQPPKWNNFIAYVANNTNPSGTTLAVVDSAQKHGGSYSVHFHGGQSPTELTYALPSGTNKLYVRAWIRVGRQFGQNSGINHDHLIGIRKTPGSADNEVRFGEVKNGNGCGGPSVLGTNEVPSDDLSPACATPSTAKIAANQWSCLEVAFLGDQAQHTLSATLDGTVVHSITSTPSQWEHKTLSATWLSGKFGEVFLGYQSFSGMDTDVWIDDVVLSTSPIGCN